MKDIYNVKPTFDTCKEKLDDMHKSVSREIEDNLKAAGAPMDDASVQREGERMTDTFTILALLGHELDKLRLRVAVLEMEQDNEPAIN